MLVYLPLRFIRLRRRAPAPPEFTGSDEVSLSAFRFASCIEMLKEFLRACLSASAANCSSFTSTADT